jgi:hypothetical protein
MRSIGIFARLSLVCGVVVTIATLSGSLLTPEAAVGQTGASLGRVVPGHNAVVAFTTRKIVNDCYHVVSRPQHFNWCGNTSDGFRHMEWSKWAAKEGRGRGLLRVNDCKPDCAGGTNHFFKVTVRVYRVVFVNSHPRFSRVSFRFVNRPNHHGQRIALLTKPIA